MRQIEEIKADIRFIFDDARKHDELVLKLLYEPREMSKDPIYLAEIPDIEELFGEENATIEDFFGDAYTDGEEIFYCESRSETLIDYGEIYTVEEAIEALKGEEIYED